jgi:predicted amidophosphoribosyltransferase
MSDDDIVKAGLILGALILGAGIIDALSKKTCPVCGKKIDKNAKQCPHCGAWLE